MLAHLHFGIVGSWMWLIEWTPGGFANLLSNNHAMGPHANRWCPLHHGVKQRLEATPDASFEDATPRFTLSHHDPMDVKLCPRWHALPLYRIQLLLETKYCKPQTLPVLHCWHGSVGGARSGQGRQLHVHAVPCTGEGRERSSAVAALTHHQTVAWQSGTPRPLPFRPPLPQRGRLLQGGAQGTHWVPGGYGTRWSSTYNKSVKGETLWWDDSHDWQCQCTFNNNIF